MIKLCEESMLKAKAGFHLHRIVYYVEQATVSESRGIVQG